MTSQAVQQILDVHQPDFGILLKACTTPRASPSPPAPSCELGLNTTSDGIDGLLPHLEADDIRIAFDAT